MLSSTIGSATQRCLWRTLRMHITRLGCWHRRRCATSSERKTCRRFCRNANPSRLQCRSGLTITPHVHSTTYLHSNCCVMLRSPLSWHIVSSHVVWPQVTSQVMLHGLKLRHIVCQTRHVVSSRNVSDHVL